MSSLSEFTHWTPVSVASRQPPPSGEYRHEFVQCLSIKISHQKMVYYPLCVKSIWSSTTPFIPYGHWADLDPLHYRPVWHFQGLILEQTSRECTCWTILTETWAETCVFFWAYFPLSKDNNMLFLAKHSAADVL